MQRKGLQMGLLSHCIMAFVIVTITGLWIRGYQMIDWQPFLYKNLLHAHSHFAFTGWLTPAITWWLLVSSPELQEGKTQLHVKRATYLLLASAYGMLFSFPFQGYGIVSIIFSGSSVLATYYLAFVVFKALAGTSTLYSRLVRMAVCFLAFSSIGAIATGPIAAMGLKETPLYFDAIHSYLHFYMNGWFCLAVVALITREHIVTHHRRNRLVAWLYFIGTILSLPLAFLWHRPGTVNNAIGGTGALLLIAATLLLVLQYGKRMKEKPLVPMIVAVVLIKSVLQVASAWQPVAEYFHLHRGLAVAYIHMITLGVGTLGVMYALVKFFGGLRYLRLAIATFIIGFALSELLLLFQSTTSLLPPALYRDLLVGVSLLFPASSIMLTWQIFARQMAIGVRFAVAKR